MRAVAFQGRCLPGTYPSVVALGGLGELCSPNNTSFPLPPLWGGREGKARASYDALLGLRPVRGNLREQIT